MRVFTQLLHTHTQHTITFSYEITADTITSHKKQILIFIKFNYGTQDSLWFRDGILNEPVTLSF
jgi:hypothetical protein